MSQSNDKLNIEYVHLNQTLDSIHTTQDVHEFPNTYEQIQHLFYIPTIEPVSPNIEFTTQTSERAQMLIKLRNRMRKRRALQRERTNEMGEQVKVLTKQLHQLMKIHSTYTSQHMEKSENSLSLSRESRHQYLMRTYIQLIIIGEQL